MCPKRPGMVADSDRQDWIERQSLAVLSLHSSLIGFRDRIMIRRIKSIVYSVFVGVLWISPFTSHAVELPADMVARLAAEKFSIREKAQAELLDWSRTQREAAMDELFRQSKNADEPEVRQRCLAVLRDLVNDDYFKSGEGYVGILMQDELARVPGDEHPRSVIRLGHVVPNSAGDQAGLKPHDLIAGMNDEVWRDGPASEPFKENISKLKPGTKVTLKVLRDGKLQDIVVKLGKRPFAKNAMIDPEVDLETLEKTAKDHFFRQWMNQQKSASPAPTKP